MNSQAKLVEKFCTKSIKNNTFWEIPHTCQQHLLITNVATLVQMSSVTNKVKCLVLSKLFERCHL